MSGDLVEILINYKIIPKTTPRKGGKRSERGFGDYLLCIGGVIGCLGVPFSSSSLLVMTISPALLALRTLIVDFCGVGEGDGDEEVSEGETGEEVIIVWGFGLNEITAGL